MNKKIKIFAYDVQPFELNYLVEITNNIGICFQFTEHPLTEKNVDLCVGYDGISVIGYSRVNEDIINKLYHQGINIVSTRTVGYDNIDIEYARKKGLVVCHAQYAPNNIAEFTVMLALMLLRKIKQLINRTSDDFSLPSSACMQLSEAKVGVIGTGKIGKLVVQILKGFGSDIIAYDINPSDELISTVTYVDIDTLYRDSDIVLVLIPGNKENHHFINDAAFKKMKDGCIFINTVRGSIVETGSLIDALKSGKLGGVGLDVIEGESNVMHHSNITENRENEHIFLLKRLPNVIYTPHCAFYTQEAIREMVNSGVVSIVNEIKGISNPYRVNNL